MARLIKVTKGDIKRGAVGDLKYCPIAYAVKRTCRQSNVQVSDGYDIKVGKVRRQAKNPERVTRFIDRFDFGQRVKPFQFYLQ